MGKGKHRGGDGNNRGILREFLMKELASWEPPINGRMDDWNQGRIWIDKTQLIAYLHNDMN